MSKRSDITDEQVVRACQLAHQDSKKFATDILAEQTGAPAKVIYAAMERADDRELIEWGVSLRTAWPTAKGLALLVAEPASQIP